MSTGKLVALLLILICVTHAFVGKKPSPEIKPGVDALPAELTAGVKVVHVIYMTHLGVYHIFKNYLSLANSVPSRRCWFHGHCP